MSSSSTPPTTGTPSTPPRRTRGTNRRSIRERNRSPSPIAEEGGAGSSPERSPPDTPQAVRYHRVQNCVQHRQVHGDKTCCICLEEILSTFTATLPCGHQFHLVCIAPVTNSCPLCRSSLW